MKIKMFDGSNPNNYTATLIQADEANILIDTGGTLDHNELIKWLSNENCNYLDALIITHFHGDHCDNMKNIINSKLFNEKSLIFKQMAPSKSNNEYAAYETRENLLNTLLPQLNYQKAITPENKKTYSFGKNKELKCTFFNTDTKNIKKYDLDAWANNGSINIRKSGINNYSLIAYFEYDGSSYLEAGDLEGMGQKLNIDYIQPATVAKVPHHTGNKMGYELFFDKINPKVWLLSNHFLAKNTTKAQTNLQAWRTSYMYRYILYNAIQAPVITNIDNHVSIELSNGNIKRINGHYMDKDYNPNDELPAQMQITGLLPPDIYYENPYILWSDKFTIEDLFNIRKHYDYINQPLSWYIPKPDSSSSTNISNASWIKALRKMFSPVSLDEAVIYLSFNKYGYPEISFSSLAHPYQTITITSATKNTINTATFSNIKNGKFGLKIEGSFKNGDNISKNNTSAWTYLRRSNILECKLNTGAYISLIRRTGYPEGVQTDQFSSFEGVSFTMNGAYIYNIYISSEGVLRCRRIKISTGAVETTWTSNGETKDLTVVSIRQIQ